MQWHWILPNVLEAEGHWISQISIPYFFSNTEEGSISKKSSYTGQLHSCQCLTSAVVSAFSPTSFPWAQWSLQGTPTFRGAFLLEMSIFHGLNRKGVGNPMEPRHLNNTLCGSESYSSTPITWAAVCVCMGNEQWRPWCVLCVCICTFAVHTQLRFWQSLQKRRAAATATIPLWHSVLCLVFCLVSSLPHVVRFVFFCSEHT